MSLTNQSPKRPFALVFALMLFGCEEKAEKESVKPAASAVAPAPTPTPTPTPPPPPPKPREDCPEGSSGIGTFNEPCKGSGDSRMMEVSWTGKTEAQGPKFKLTSKTKKPIVYGSIAAYFYDKAGKQLEVTHGGKPRPMQICSGNIFGGTVKPEETFHVFFSCVKKEHVPEGTKTIEAEIKMVGFADDSGEKTEFYWSNMDLVPDERPKGGLKSKKTKKK